MELTQLQMSEFLSNYTNSSEGFVTLQSLILNSLMGHERELFVRENTDELCNGFRPRRWYSHGFDFSLRIPRKSQDPSARSGCGNAKSRSYIE